MSSTYIALPPVSWREPVPTAAELPASGNQSGDAIITQDTQTIYVWDGATWQPVSSGMSGVTAVTATAPITSSGGATPNIAVNSGNLTDAGTDGITVTGGTGAVLGSGAAISQHVSDSTHNGYLSSTDWSTFNAKQPAGNYITQLTGDVLATGPGTIIARLNSLPDKVWVDFTNGDDTTGTGTLLNPWKTLGHMYASISPSVNTPYVCYISGGNNDVESTPIAGKPNVSLIADVGTQIHGITIGASASNDGATFVNLIFLETLTWVKNDFWGLDVTFINTQFFSGPLIQQNGTGNSFAVAYQSLFIGSEWRITGGGVFYNCNFYGSTTFDSIPSTFAPYIQMQGCYNLGAMSFSGAVNPIYFSGFIQDTVFGASLTFNTTGDGTPAIEFDSAGLPPTITGSPSMTFLSFAQWTSYTPADSSKWSGNPITVKEAIDRLAAVVGNITPIP